MQAVIWYGVIQKLSWEELLSRVENVLQGVGGGQNALASPYTTSTLERGSCSGFGRYQAVETRMGDFTGHPQLWLQWVWPLSGR